MERIRARPFQRKRPISEPFARVTSGRAPSSGMGRTRPPRRSAVAARGDHRDTVETRFGGTYTCYRLPTQRGAPPGDRGDTVKTRFGVSAAERKTQLAPTTVVLVSASQGRARQPVGRGAAQRTPAEVIATQAGFERKPRFAHARTERGRDGGRLEERRARRRVWFGVTVQAAVGGGRCVVGGSNAAPSGSERGLRWGRKWTGTICRHPNERGAHGSLEVRRAATICRTPTTPLA